MQQGIQKLVKKTWLYYVSSYRQFSFGSGKVLLISVLIGLLAAFGAIFFQLAVDLCKYVFLHQIVGLSLEGPAGEVSLFHSDPSDYRWYMLLIIPPLGGLISGILVTRFAPEAKGHGTDGVIESYHFRRGYIRPAVPIIKTIASAITIGTGGSAGKEGPIAQIAAGIASFVGRKFHLSSRDMRILVIAGLAAGIGATFRAPLAAGLFAAEVLYREMDFDRDVIMPALVSPIIAYAVFTSFFQAGPLFATPDMAFTHSWELLPYTLVALIVGLGSRVFVSAFYKSESFFEKLSLAPWLKPALGGLAVGIIGIAVPESLSESYGVLQKAHLNEISFHMLIVFILAKMATTSLTIGSGGSGGVFGPSIVIGGLMGGLVGLMVNAFTPVSQSAYVIVGMAGFFSAAANTPISTIFMVSEMTGNYELLVPTMWVSSLAYILGRGSTLYKKQLWNHFEAPSQLEETRAAILRKMTVGEASQKYDSLQLVSADSPLSQLDERALHDQREFGVISKSGRFIGIITRQSIRHAKNHRQFDSIASDLMDHGDHVTYKESLWSAMQKMLKKRKEQLFVIDEECKPITILKKQQIMTAYDRRMSGQSQEQKDLHQESSMNENIPIQNVFYDVPCTNQKHLLRFLSRIVANEDTEKAERYYQSLLEREELSSTAIGHGYAFPHPQTRDLVEDRCGIYIISTINPIDYHAPDQKGVDKFILFWLSDSNTHIEALATIAKAVSQGELTELIEAKAPLSSMESLLSQLRKKLQDEP
ncbi:MAG: chloride channel protein [Acidobacteria bacterium]|nr:MAG: chloride channel protein [Acidobacteriota bacterium]